MQYYVRLTDKTIQIIPRWKIKISREYLTDQEFLQEVSLMALNGNFYIPLKNFKIDRVPHKVTIYYGNSEYGSLDELVDYIYNSRSYSSTEEKAKNLIKNLLLKGLMSKKKVYGRTLKHKFSEVDASGYELKI